MKLKSIILNLFYFFCLLIIVFICINSSSINRINIDKYKVNNSKEEVNIVLKEKISRWVNIPTYDGSNEITHPKVLYFKDGYGGYKYWMVTTPYPLNDAYLENPSIVVSNDGINWIEPKGIKNPVSGYPNKYRDDSYYSDPFMLYDKDHFEMFFRKTRSVLDGIVNINGYNYIYWMTSEDGINWSKPKKILDNNPPERYMSISVIKENELYKMWYVNYDGKVRYVESVDLINFTEPITVNLENFNINVWHGEVQYINNKYIYIFMIKYNLYYTESEDGINFDEPKLINTKLDILKNYTNHIYKPTYIVSDDYIELYVPYRINYSGYRYTWRLHYKKIPKEEFLLKNE